MYVYLQAYDGGTTTAAVATATPTPTAGATPTAPAVAKPAAPLIAFVTLYREDKKAFESAPVAVTPMADSRLGIVPLSFKIGLSDLAAGEYQCQVSVLDPSGHRVAFWVNPIMLVK